MNVKKKRIGENLKRIIKGGKIGENTAETFMKSITESQARLIRPLIFVAEGTTISRGLFK